MTTTREMKPIAGATRNDFRKRTAGGEARDGRNIHVDKIRVVTRQDILAYYMTTLCGELHQLVVAEQVRHQRGKNKVTIALVFSARLL